MNIINFFLFFIIFNRNIDYRFYKNIFKMENILEIFLEEVLKN